MLARPRRTRSWRISPTGRHQVEWGREKDLEDARRLTLQYASLHLGLVDAVVIAVAIRRRATAIATLDVHHFAAVKIPGSPRL